MRRFFPRAEPVGKLFGGATNEPAKGQYQIIGVVSDAKYRSLREPMTPTNYSTLEARQRFVSTGGAHHRPSRIRDRAGAPRARFHRPRAAVHRDQHHVRRSRREPRAGADDRRARIDFRRSRRGARRRSESTDCWPTRWRRDAAKSESAWRSARGPSDIAAMIGRQTVAMAAAGIVLGLGAAFLAAPWIRSLLYGIAPADPVSLATPGCLSSWFPPPRPLSRPFARPASNRLSPYVRKEDKCFDKSFSFDRCLRFRPGEIYPA